MLQNHSCTTLNRFPSRLVQIIFINPRLWGRLSLFFYWSNWRSLKQLTVLYEFWRSRVSREIILLNILNVIFFPLLWTPHTKFNSIQQYWVETKLWETSTGTAQPGFPRNYAHTWQFRTLWFITNCADRKSTVTFKEWKIECWKSVMGECCAGGLSLITRDSKKIVICITVTCKPNTAIKQTFH